MQNNLSTIVIDQVCHTNIYYSRLQSDRLYRLCSLTSRNGIKSIHIVSQGSPGSLQLGTAQLSLTNFNTYAYQLQQWSAALADAADILLYGCEVAAGERGIAFVQQLSRVTGADVAASASLIGNATLGGNWDLEFSTGKIETPLAFYPEVWRRYDFWGYW